MADIDTYTKDEYQSLLMKRYQEANTIMSYFMVGFFLLGLFLSIFNSTWLLGLVLGGANLAIFFVARNNMGNNKAYRVLVSIQVLVFVEQFLFQMKEIPEMYFFFFIGLISLLFYQDWRIYIAPLIFPFINFMIFYWADQPDAMVVSGGEVAVPVPEEISEDNLMPLESIVIYLLTSVIFAGMCMLWAIMQRQRTLAAEKNLAQMHQQLRLMDTNIKFADNISKGNLKADYLADEADRLGESLMNMRDSLIEAADRETKEKFLNVGLASIGEILRNNSDNLVTLCDKVIEKLVNYMKANQGGIFIINDDDPSDPYLELLACRAYERKKYMEKRISLGQGLVGQAAIEKETIYMLDIPQNYMNITSGLGHATPSSLLIVPLKSNEDIIGVVEMASFEKFTDADIEFLEKVGESIASTVISAKTNQTTKELLEQSKQMTEEMKAQEEEMRQNMEEMQATQEEMARTQHELAAKEANLNALINNTSDSIIVIDNNYKIVVMNDIQKERYKGTQYEVMQEGSNALEALGALRDQWKGYYDKALAGERLNFTIKSAVQGESTYREYFINPIKEKSGEIIGASIFSRDVTEKMSMEQELMKKGFVLDAMINSSNNTYFAMDTDYRVILANNVLKQRFAESGSSLNVGDNILNRMDGEAKEKWKARYDRALQGESFSIEEPRHLGDKTLYLRAHCEPIKNEEEKIIGAAVVSRDITQEVEAMKKIEELTAEVERLKNK